MIALNELKGKMVKKIKTRIKSFVARKEKALDENINGWIKKNPAIEILQMASSMTTVSHHKVKFLVTILISSVNKKFQFLSKKLKFH